MIEVFAVGGLCVMALIITYMFYKGVVYLSHDIPSYRYEIDKNGLIKKCNIITPTAQFLNNIEADLKVWLKQIRRLSKKEQERKIKMLIRAYDPCITCATH